MRDSVRSSGLPRFVCYLGVSCRGSSLLKCAFNRRCSDRIVVTFSRKSMEWVTVFGRPMDEEAQKREEFLQKYYHHLVRCIQPSSFYSWLRTNKVLTEDEQEEVETKYQIRSLRAGYLIDLIMRKGEPGYVAFMECVEYIYPDLYEDITGNEPRVPPKSFKGTPGRSLRRKNTNRTRSSEVMVLMADLMHKLTQEVAEKKTKLLELQQLISGVQNERESEENEKSSLYAELDIMREQNEELKLDNDKLQKKLNTANADRQGLQTRCNEMQVKTDEYIAQCNQLREKMEKMGCKMEELHGEVRRERSRPISCNMEKLTKENEELKKTLELQISNGPKNGISDGKVADFRLRVIELEKQIEEMSAEKDGLQEQCKRLEEMSTMLQENNSERQNSIKHFVAERDQYRKLYEETVEQLRESQRVNDEISGQCRVYHDRICQLSERMKDLDDEIASLKNERLTGFYPNDGDLEKRDSLTNDPISPTLRRPKESGSKERRKGSYETLKRDPLVVFMPKEIESPLVQCLKKHFNHCPFDTCQVNSEACAKVVENPEVFCFKKSSTAYSFIQKAKLRQKERNTVLLSVPVHCVRQMTEQLKINPIVVIVKFKSKDSIPEYTQEEEMLNRSPAMRFDVITVDSDLKNSFSIADADTVVNQLKEMVERENVFRETG